MYISLDWLKDFVDISADVTPQKLGDDLTVHVAEVEEVVDQAASYENMVIGEIKEIKDHPNADKLKICMTDIGETELAQIVCGGENIYEGMKVAVAKIGAKVKWHGEGDFIEMKKAKIRGEESNGMICASAEIGLALSTEKQPEGPKGVMDLKEINKSPGTPLAAALGLTDVIIEIDNKSITNRPDLWGHKGVAREIAAMYGSSFKENHTELNSASEEILRQASSSAKAMADKQGNNLKISIENSDLCLRYTALKLDNIAISESPDWLKKRLLAVGQRPINNLVDISNYVMFELGQPVHIFDAKKIANETIIVRAAKKDESFKTLDGVERKLDSQMLMIADSEKLIAIAGVMGGENSEVEENTKTIIIESANFEAKSVRKTSQVLGLRTEASARFEKGLDPNLALEAVVRVAQLVQQVIPDARIVSGISDEGKWSENKQAISTSIDFISRRIGISMNVDTVLSILESIGCQVEGNKDITITPPSWRADLQIPEDIVEEVSRLYGYDKIPSVVPLVDTKGKQQTNFPLELRRDIKRYLSFSGGLYEVENTIFDYEPISKTLGIDLEDRLEVMNPLAEGQEFLRKSLLPRLIKNVRDNLRYQDECGLFELGRIFKSNASSNYFKSKDLSDALPEQSLRLGMVFSHKEQTKEDIFYKMKGIVAGLFEYLHISYELIPNNGHSWLTNGYELSIVVNGSIIGEIGILHEDIAAQQKIIAPVAVAYINHEILETTNIAKLKYTPLPEFPALTRDIAIVVENTVRYSDLENCIRSQSLLLEEVTLFDVFEGSQIGQGKRSYAWHLVLRDKAKTLTSEEADKELQKILAALEKDFKAQLRA